MKLSVIIPAYNQDELIKYHVEFCMKSTLVPDEIIVVNDGGADTLKDILKGIEKKTNLIYAKIDQNIEWNQPGARNLGVWLSRGDYLAMEDADHFPPDTYYEDAFKLDRDIVIAHNRRFINFDDLRQGNFENWKRQGTHRFVSVMKREVYLKLKGFDERFCGLYGWDVPDWIRRCNRNGITVGMSNFYWTVRDGFVKDLHRRTDANGKFYPRADNYKVLQSNDMILAKQHPEGILKFTYSYEYL